MSTSTLTPREIQEAHGRCGSGEDLAGAVYLVDADKARLCEHVGHPLTLAPGAGSRLLVQISGWEIEPLVRSRMGVFARVLLAKPTVLEPLQILADRGVWENRPVANWLSEFVGAAATWDADAPLGAWNPITRRAEDLAAAEMDDRGNLLVRLTDDTIASLLRPFYEPLHRALGLDLAVFWS